MKKLAILTLLTTFLTSQVFAAMWTPHPVECYDCAIDLKSPSKVLAGYGDNRLHDQAPNWNTLKTYELKFDTPITCYDCDM